MTGCSKQRAALLKTAGLAKRAGKSGDLSTLDVWDGHLAEHGAQLLVARLELVQALTPYAVEAYAQTGSSSGELALRYVSSIETSLGNDTDVIPPFRWSRPRCWPNWPGFGRRRWSGASPWSDRTGTISRCG